MSLIVAGGVLDLSAVSPTEIAELFRAANERKIFVAEAAGVLTVNPTRSSTRSASRAARQVRTQRFEVAVLSAIAKLGETKIGPLVKEVATILTDADPSTLRNDVLTACRALRDRGELLSLNRNPAGSSGGGANFRMTWDLPPAPAVETTASGDVESELLNAASAEGTVDSTAADVETGSDVGETARQETFDLIGDEA